MKPKSTFKIRKDLAAELDAMITINAYRPWTPEVDAIIIEYNGKISYLKIARFITKKYFPVSITSVWKRYHTLTDKGDE